MGVGAGPTCDAADLLYRHPHELPLDVAAGDEIEFLSAGAYGSSAASAGPAACRRSRPTF